MKFSASKCILLCMKCLLCCGRCSEKVDIFSYGILLWEIISQETPQRGMLRELKVSAAPRLYFAMLCWTVSSCAVLCCICLLLSSLTFCSAWHGMQV